MNARSVLFGAVLWVLVVAVFFLPRPVLPQDAAAADVVYAVFSNDGETFTVRELAERFVSADVILAGELHGHAPGHAFQRDFFGALISVAEGHGKRAVLSMEMFEQDVQLVLDEYVAGLIREREFLRDVRPWSNYPSDYRPLVELARENDVPVVAANVPRRYAALVAREGPDALALLPGASGHWLPALPVPNPSEAYERKFRDYMQRAVHEAHAAPAAIDTSAAGAARHPTGINTDHLLQAQILKDAAMAEAISEAARRHDEAVIFHINGSFHSDERLGVVEYLRHVNPGLSVLTLTIVASETFSDFDPAAYGHLADFVVVTPPRVH